MTAEGKRSTNEKVGHGSLLEDLGIFWSFREFRWTWIFMSTCVNTFNQKSAPNFIFFRLSPILGSNIHSFDGGYPNFWSLTFYMVKHSQNSDAIFAHFIVEMLFLLQRKSCQNHCFSWVFHHLLISSRSFFSRSGVDVFFLNNGLIDGRLAGFVRTWYSGG